MEFINWVEGYKKECPDLKVEEAISVFRTVMDVGYCEEPERRHNWGWVDARGIFGSGV